MSARRGMVLAGLLLAAASAPAQEPDPSRLGVADISRWESPAADHRLAYGDDALQFGDLYLPVGPGPHPVAVFVHGGCWLSQFDITHSARFAEALAAAGIATWSLEYRRVGDEGGGWPGTFLDVANGADHLEDIADRHQLDLGRVIAVGHSAGGQLALWLGARSTWVVRQPPFHERVPLELRGVLALAPAPDLARLHEEEVCGHVIDRLMGGSPEAHPKRYRIADATRFSPFHLPHVVMVGRHDTTWAPSGRAYFEVARKNGDEVTLVEAPNAGHFELIDPESSSWPLVLENAKRLLGLEP